MVRSFFGGIAAVKVGKNWGYIDRTGKPVIPLQFDDAKHFQGRFSVVSSRGKWIWIDKTGRTVVETEIDLIP
jgi:hypothetical protein